MEIILNNAKFADWMRNFHIEIPKPTPRKLFQWMEDGVIPFWMFPDIHDRNLDPDDEQYFHLYDVDHHSKVALSEAFKWPSFTVAYKGLFKVTYFFDISLTFYLERPLIEKIEDFYKDKNRFSCMCHICFIILHGPYVFLFSIFLFKATFDVI